MAGNDYSTVAMILAIIGAVLILIGGVLLVLAASAASSTTAMSVYAGVYGAQATQTVITAMWISGILGLISGIIVLIGGILIKNPNKRMIGSILVLVFGIVSFFGGGGFLIGMILAILAGILGLVSK